VTVTLDRDPLPRDREPNGRALGAGAAMDLGVEGDAAPRAHQLRWWHEVVAAATFYAIYSFVRGQFGSAAASTAQAAANANQIIGIERTLGVYNELAVQQWFLHAPAIVRALNVFYGLFHFVAPIAVLVLLYRRAPGRYRRGRNTLAATTALALIGFCLYPLMPPRLLCDCPLGSGVDAGFVDTLTRFGGLWSFGSHGVGAVSNQYAAMPSLHFAWAVFCAVTVHPLLRRRWTRSIAVLYPVLTLLAIIVTANHFWLDAVGGAAVYGAGFGLVSGLERLVRRPSRNRERDHGACEDSVHRIARATTEAVP
jgi:hypothetical protein